jgi:hypothetical protein
MYALTLELPLVANRSLVINARKGKRSGVTVTAKVRKARTRKAR